MSNDLRNFLTEIYLDNENHLAGLLAFYYPSLNFSDKKSLLEGLLYYYTISEDNKLRIEENATASNKVNLSEDNIDYRIKHLQLASVRGIPERDLDNLPFGIDFFEDGVINNAIILANNGTGKSSVFSALEFIYTQEISEKRLRMHNDSKITKSEYEDYLKRYPYATEPHCSITTSTRDFTFDNIVFENEELRKIFNPSNHFISDFDIYHYGQKDFDGDADNRNSFHSLIADSLGLGEFIQLQSIIKETSAYKRLTEGNNLKKLENQRLDSEKNIIAYGEQIKAKDSEINNLNEKRSTNNNVVNTDRIRKINELQAKPMTYSLGVDSFRSAVLRFSDVFKKSLSIAENSKNNTERNFLSLGRELLDSHTNCPFCQNSLSSIETIKYNVELRLISLKDSLALDEEVRSNYKNVLDLIQKFYTETFDVYERINTERVEIAGLNELRDVFSKEELLYIKLSLVINDTDLIDHIQKLNSIPYPTIENYKDLYELTIQNVINSYVQSINDVELFIAERNNLLAEVINETNELVKGQGLSIDQQIAILNEDIKRLNNQKETLQAQIVTLNPQIEKAQKEADLVSLIKNELKELLRVVDSRVNKMVNDAFDPIQDSVQTILKEYLSEDSIILKISKRERKTEIDGEEVTNYVIVANIECLDKVNGGIITVTPDVYFNTFRYKLFCLMVNLSLALATRKKYNVNLPLVIDDIFFASDFISKNSFAQFFQKVISLFYKYTPNLPLQFILLTHDDLIFRSTIDAIDAFKIESDIDLLCTENKIKLQERTIIGRFFSPNDREQNPRLFQNGEKFWNLLYKIPKSVAHLVNN